MDGSTRGLVKAKTQMAALASGARQEIVDVLPRLGTASVADLARALERPPDSLYYHIRALERVGLIVTAGHRRAGRREEALYRAVAPQLELQLEPRTPSRVKAAAAIVGSLMRMGARDYRRSIARPHVAPAGPGRDLWALRTTGWLTPDQVAKVVRLIERLVGDMSRPKGDGALHSLSLVFAPLHQRGRERIRPE